MRESCPRRCIGGPYQTPRCGQDQRVFDHLHGQAALVELRGQHPVRTADSPHRARRFAIGLQDLTNIFFLAAAVVHDGVLPQTAQQRFHHWLAAQKILHSS